jgi:hypothetical protein
MDEFEDAEAGYFRLRSFMSDADPSRRVRLDTATSLYRSILGFMAPLRERGVATNRTIHDEAALKNVLDEAKSTDTALRQLSSLLNTWEADMKAELGALVDSSAMAALNHVLRGQKLPEVSPPPIAESYGRAAEAFLAFNRAVNQRGRSFFEEANRRTSWRTWVEIHQALSSGTYREGPEHDSSELEQMGLIKKSVTLE